jgi:hypothetical protein
MRLIVVTTLVAICFSACPSSSGTTKPLDTRTGAARLTEDERHRLYSAALAASESPLDSQIFKEVCRKIGIFDVNDKPNEEYMAFVARHIDWSMKAENGQFRSELDTKERARQYINLHLP